MAHALLEYLDPEESAGLAEFLVEMVALEETIDRLLVRYYAAEGRGEEFAEHFLRRMTLGNKLDRLPPALAQHAERDGAMEILRTVVRVRNVVAHGLPRTEFDGWTRGDDDYEPPNFYRVYRGADRAVDARTLTDWARAAAAGRLTLGGLLESQGGES